jgi:hypothetical protein
LALFDPFLFFSPFYFFIHRHLYNTWSVSGLSAGGSVLRWLKDVAWTAQTMPQYVVQYFALHRYYILGVLGMRELFLISKPSGTVGTSFCPKPDRRGAKEKLSRKFSHRASISGPGFSVQYCTLYGVWR